MANEGNTRRDELKAFARTLESEGYALEFEAAQAFSAAGFDVSQNVGYPTPEQNSAREADVAAYMSERCGSGTVSVSIAVECKGFWKSQLGVFVADGAEAEPQAKVFDIGDYLRGVNVRQEPVALTLPADEHGFKAVLKQSKNDERRDVLWEALQQVLSARDGLASVRGDREAVTKVAVLVTNATLAAVRNTSDGLVARTVESAAVRVAGALGRTQDAVVIVHRSGLGRFAEEAAHAVRLYLRDLSQKLHPHFEPRPQTEPQSVEADPRPSEEGSR